MRDQDHDVIYVGKAKNLRRRLSQYKNAKRRRKHAKMRAIVAEAASITYETARTDLEACLIETRLIQELRPKWNVAGAFFFLYPLIGLQHRDGEARFCFTTEPELFSEFEFFGAYRSRHITKDAYFALIELLEFIGHRVRKRGSARVSKRRSYVIGFRQIGPDRLIEWTEFFRGVSRTALENLSLALIENADARHQAADIQEKLNLLKRFWRHEASPLKRAIDKSAWSSYPISQRERDLLFLHAKGGT